MTVRAWIVAVSVAVALALPFFAKGLVLGEDWQWLRLLTLAPGVMLYAWWDWRDTRSCDDDDLSVEESLALTGAA